MKKLNFLLIAIFLFLSSFTALYSNFTYNEWTLTDTIEGKRINAHKLTSHFSGNNVFFSTLGSLYKYIPKKNKFFNIYSDEDGADDYNIMALTSVYNYEITGNTKSGKIITIKDVSILSGMENEKDSISLKTRSQFSNKPPGSWNYNKGESMIHYGYSEKHNYAHGYLFTNGSPYLCQIKITEDDTLLLEYDLSKINGFDANYPSKTKKTIIDYKSNYWFPTYAGILRVDLENSTDDTLCYELFTREKLNNVIYESIVDISTDYNGVYLVSSKGRFLFKGHNDTDFQEIPIPDSYKPDPTFSAQGFASINLLTNGNFLLFYQMNSFFIEYNTKNKTFYKTDFPQVLMQPYTGEDDGKFYTFVYNTTYDYKKNIIWISAMNGIISYDLSKHNVTDNNIKGIIPNIYISSLTPNPVSTSSFTANLRCFPDGVDNVEAKLYNYLGTEIIDFTPNLQIDNLGYCTLNCNTHGLPVGLYIFTLKKGNEITTKNVIIN